MKKTLSAVLAASIAASVCSVFQAAAADNVLLNSTFEDGLGGWTGRGGAQVAVTSDVAASGSKSAAVTGRTDAWNGIAYTLDSATFPAGSTISVSAMVFQQDTPAGVNFKMTVQYGGGGGMTNRNHGRSQAAVSGHSPAAASAAALLRTATPRPMTHSLKSLHLPAHGRSFPRKATRSVPAPTRSFTSKRNLPPAISMLTTL